MRHRSASSIKLLPLLPQLLLPPILTLSRIRKRLCHGCRCLGSIRATPAPVCRSRAHGIHRGRFASGSLQQRPRRRRISETAMRAVAQECLYAY